MNQIYHSARSVRQGNKRASRLTILVRTIVAEVVTPLLRRAAAAAEEAPAVGVSDLPRVKVDELLIENAVVGVAGRLFRL